MKTNDSRDLRPVDPRLVEIVRCPVTRMPVEPLDGARLERLNALIAVGRVSRADGSPVSAPLDGGLVTRDGARVYPVEQGIPAMRPETAIETERLEGFRQEGG